MSVNILLHILNWCVLPNDTYGTKLPYEEWLNTTVQKNILTIKYFY